MRIVQLTPGTGNFHCGNCIRDNAMVNAMRAMGHDVLMIPLYLPHVVDEKEAAQGMPIFFGGINVYLEQKLALFRHTPAWIDRLFNSTALLRWAANRAGMTGAHDLGELTVSMLLGEQGHQNKELTRLIDWLKTQPRPDVVCLSNALLMGLARRIRSELNVSVVCTLSGEDAFLDTLVPPYRDRCWRLLSERAADVDAFIAVSRYYGDQMTRRLKLDRGRVHVVYNGIDLTGYAPAAAPPPVPTVGFLARLHPCKGLETIVEAFIRLKQKPGMASARLRAAGAVTPSDRLFVEKVKRRLSSAGVADDVDFQTNIDHAAKQAFLQSISVLSVPATYGESFGLYLLEAWAAAVPVVQPRHAAFIELIEDTGGGMLCDPDDPAALADALHAMLSDPQNAHRMGQTARAAVVRRFSIEHMTRQVLGVFEQAAHRAPTHTAACA